MMKKAVSGVWSKKLFQQPHVHAAIHGGAKGGGCAEFHARVRFSAKTRRAAGVILSKSSA